MCPYTIPLRACVIAGIISGTHLGVFRAISFTLRPARREHYRRLLRTPDAQGEATGTGPDQGADRLREARQLERREAPDTKSLYPRSLHHLLEGRTRRMAA